MEVWNLLDSGLTRPTITSHTRESKFRVPISFRRHLPIDFADEKNIQRMSKVKLLDLGQDKQGGRPQNAPRPRLDE